ncbi:MAG: hypothetical protein HY710_09015 [Candidatus Latescibacteria bacterium]|nr:hypothetical protein [Candidatus Latescibacterota bacterium]
MTALRDSLLGDYTQLWLRQQREDLLGESTKQRLGAIRADLLGEKTRALLGNIRDDLLGDATRMQAVALATLLRDELLNSTTRKALDAIVASAVKTSAEGYEAQWRPRLREDADFLKDRVREEEGFLKKHVTKLLWTAGGIVALLLVLGGLIFARGWRYRKILEVLTYQIHKIPDQPAYDELTRRIREKAQEVGVEPHLRKLLQKRGILGKESWTPPA